MFVRTLAAMIVVISVVGCGSKGLQKESKWDTCDIRGGSAGAPAKCIIEVSVSGQCPTDDITVNNLSLRTDPATPNDRYARVIWKLPANYRFCSASGDGAFLKDVDADEQFGDAAATDRDDGDVEPGGGTKCKKFFRLHDANSASTSGKNYAYHIQFTDHRNQRCQIDPLIRNG